MTPRFILASGSPRRRELLASLNVSFEVVASVVDEQAFVATLVGKPPSEIVEALALEKALEVAGRVAGEALILGADTTVVLGGEMLNKPVDEDDAVRMLLQLSGNVHQVYTGVALIRSVDGAVAAHRVTHCVTDVEFAPMSEQRARAYVATGEPMDKAGAYGIQAFGALLVSRINGDYFNVVGLPLHRLGVMLGEMGIELL